MPEEISYKIIFDKENMGSTQKKQYIYFQGKNKIPFGS
jgi:hypothetical protein